MFPFVSVRHVGAHPGEHQHSISIQISISLVKLFFGYLVYEIFLWPESWWGSLYMYLLSFPRFWTLSIERFDFYFDLFWMAWHWKPAISHFTVVCSVCWPLNRSEAGGDLVLLQTFLLFTCKSWYFHANRLVNMIIYIWKTTRFVTKQSHRHPRFYSKARALNSGLLFSAKLNLIPIVEYFI